MQFFFNFFSKLWSSFVQTLFKFCSNLDKILFKFCSNFVQILLKFCPILSKFCPIFLNFFPILIKFCSNFSQLLSNFVQIWINIIFCQCIYFYLFRSKLIQFLRFHWIWEKFWNDFCLMIAKATYRIAMFHVRSKIFQPIHLMGTAHLTIFQKYSCLHT